MTDITLGALAKTHTPARWFRLAFSALVLGVVVVVSHLLGRDPNWDFLNYHFYGPYLMLEQRWAQDYFAGSFQGYLNPLPYVPQYLMIRHGWSGPLVSAVLAMAQAVNLLFVWLIARAVLPNQLAAARREALAMLAVVLALLAPLFITTAGSSFVDGTTSVPVLAATWLLLKAGIDPAAGGRKTLIASCGLLLGLAAGLKPTNGVLALGVMLPCMASWVGSGARAALLRSSLLVAAAVLGFLLAHGYWSWKLWLHFGNPFFPLFNGIFQSPDFPLTNYRDTRFLGPGWAGLVTLPLQMLLPVSWLYAENAPVDFRPAMLVLLLLASLVVILRNTFAGRPRAHGPVTPALLLVTAMVFASYLLWGMTSRIGRYALPVWLLVGPLVVAWALVLIRRFRLVVTLLATVVVVQLYGLWVAGNPRWSPTEWEPAWFDARVPAELAGRPVTLLTLNNLSFSAVVPFLHPESRVVNMVGQHLQPAGPRMTPRMKALLDTPTADLRIAFKDQTGLLDYEGRLAPRTQEDVSAILSVYGLRLADRDCQPIEIPYRLMIPVAEGGAPLPPRPPVDRLHVCAVERLDAASLAAVLAERDRIAKVFDAIEAACGGQLSPHGTELLRGRNGWMRSYFNSLHTLNTDGHAVYVRPFRSISDLSLGTLERWTRPAAPSCPKLPSAISAQE
jgi:hypothetical protein